MGFSRFMFGVTLRLILLMSSLLVLVYLFLFPDYPAATLLVGTVIVILTINIYDFVSKTNHELARFLDAVRYADFGQRFSFTNVGAGFSELGETFTHILDRFREDRKQQESELRYLKALLEHVPVPLITLHGDGKISLWNNASRRLFGVAKINTTKDLIVFGENFYQELESILPGEKRLVEFTFDGMSQGLSITASEIVIASQAEKLISLQNIQSELDGMQLSAWQDLVKVLTHEIMNSITPVSSLAKTAAELVDDASNK
ncbi:MAG: two-component system nitrogen regulation sensor histidine kinase NtrY, partial [Candidatus Azotimanducaceae bacterium]